MNTSTALQQSDGQETQVASFEWDKHFETGLATVDTQHHALVDLINRFGALATAGIAASAADMEETVTQLAVYARYHFQDEERMMTEHGVDARHLALHQHLHAEFLAEVTEMRTSVLQQREAPERLLKFLTYWLASHILGTDQSMARQMAAMRSGDTAAQAFAAEASRHEGATEPLLKALNGLFHQLSERNAELKQANRTLEAKVQERTLALSEANRELEQLAVTDVLTGLPNRRYAMNRLAQEWESSRREGKPLACLMIDADKFKQVNDTYGHDAGDEVLRQLARQLRYAVRNDDQVCRLGGDEFLIMGPATTHSGAEHLAEVVGVEVASLRVPMAEGGDWLGSISIGVSAMTADMAGPEALIKAADNSLYLAKRHGRHGAGRC